MADLNGLKNGAAALLEKVLDGNNGSNILGALFAALMAANLNYSQVLEGFKCDNMANSMQTAKAIGAVIVALFAYFVGKKKKPEAKA